MRTETRLDYATFQLDEARTRCELWVTAGNETEKLASGSLKPFLTHLHEAQKQIARGQTSVRLQVPSLATNGRSSWFTKGTIERFVRFVTTPDVLERVSIVESERRQLEEAINILAVGDQQSKQTPGSVGLEGEDVIDGDATGDGSKNQLLMAMDARRIMLQKEQLNAFGRAAAAGFDIGCMADLMDFADCFGASRLREACFKFAAIYKKMQEKGQLLDLEVDVDMDIDAGEDSFQKHSRARRTWGAQDKSAIDHLHQSRVETISDSYEDASGNKSNQNSPCVAGKNAESMAAQSTSLYGSPSHSQNFRAIPDSPPNIMDAQSPSTEGTNSQQETPTSRRLPRRASSPRRRSCSPLRKVQIGRSGSRRPGLVVIRNINYASSNLQDSTKSSQPTEANDSTDESESVHESEDSKVERHRRLSVQDAISLFERRQRDLVEAQTVKVEARRASMDPTVSGKSVLRRWSGISETAASCAKTNSSMCTPDQVHAGKSFNLPEQHVSTSGQESVQEDNGERRKSCIGTSNDLEWKFQQLKIQEAALPPVRNSKDSVHNASPMSSTLQQKAADMQFGFQYRGQRSRGPLSKSWTATSEQDLLSLVHKAEIDTGDQHKMRVQGRREEQGRFYEQYREIRDAKIRQESGLKRAERESKLRAMHEVLERRKAELVAGSGRAAEKSNANTNERQDKLHASRTPSMKKMPQENIKTQQGRPTSRSSPTLQSTATTPRAIRQQLPVEPKSSTARKLSPSAQKSVSSTSSGRGVTSSPKSITRNSGAPTQRRPGSSTQFSAYGNPLSRSMPSLSELRKENTRPATRSGAPAQQSKVAPAKHSQPKAGGSAVRHRSVNKVMPLEPNGVIPSDCVLQVPADRSQTALKKKPSPAFVEDSQPSTPLKLIKDIQAQVSPRLPVPVHMSAFQETKPFLRKGRGIGPGAGPGVMKLKAAVPSEAEEAQADNDDDSSYEAQGYASSFPLAGTQTLESQGSAETLESQDPVGASCIEPEGFSGSVRESLEMDIDIQTTSNEPGQPKPGGNFEGSNVEMFSATRTQDPVEVDGTSIDLKDDHTAADVLVAPIQDNIILGTADMVSNTAVLTPGLKLDSAIGSSPTKLTLMQQLASDEYAELMSPAQLTVLSHTSTNDRRASLASVGSSSPCSSPAAGIPNLRHSVSPDLDGVKYEIAQSRKKWGGSQKPVPLNSQQGSKEGPKGFKRLLKFGRKSRGSGSNTTEWVSASTTSEGDEDTDESRDTGYSNGTTILRRSTEAFSKETDVVNSNGSRSFFSLSSFRSKGSESKSRS